MLENLLVYANFMFAALMPFSHIGGYLSASFGAILLWSYHKKIEKEPLFYFLVAFMVYGILINLFSAQPSIGFGTMLGYFSHWLLPFVLGYGLVKSEYFHKVYWTFIFVFAIIVGFSVLSYFHLFYQQIGKDFYLVNEGLLKGLRSHIALAALCLLASFLILTQALLRKNISALKRLGFFALFLFFVFALFLTGSRGYYIAAFITYIAFGIFWLLRTKNWRFLVIGITGLVIVIISAYLFTPIVKERINKTTLRDTNISERLSLYNVALKEIKDRPVFGFGPGQGIRQKKYFEDLQGDLKLLNRHPALHSFYLNFGADFGLTGLLFFLAVVYLIFARLKKSFDSNDLFLACAGIGLFWGFAGILLGEIFDTLLRGPGVAMELFWLIGLIFSQIREKECESAAQQ